MILEGLKLAKRKTGSVAQVVECRLSKGEALSSNLNTPKGKKKRLEKRKGEIQEKLGMSIQVEFHEISLILLEMMRSNVYKRLPVRETHLRLVQDFHRG
jgi:hypothetical protein